MDLKELGRTYEGRKYIRTYGGGGMKMIAVVYAIIVTNGEHNN